ncbi:MAG TPA: hypothetical protein DCO89_01990, partial [Clostridiales bacterium]|nr:hypothetical protein [Clostridiales bacterium]
MSGFKSSRYVQMILDIKYFLSQSWILSRKFVASVLTAACGSRLCWAMQERQSIMDSSVETILRQNQNIQIPTGKDNELEKICEHVEKNWDRLYTNMQDVKNYIQTQIKDEKIRLKIELIFKNLEELRRFYIFLQYFRFKKGIGTFKNVDMFLSTSSFPKICFFDF